MTVARCVVFIFCVFCVVFVCCGAAAPALAGGATATVGDVSSAASVTKAAEAVAKEINEIKGNFDERKNIFGLSQNTIERTGDSLDLLDSVNERIISALYYAKQISDDENQAEIGEVTQLIEESNDKIKDAFEALLELRKETNKL